LVKFGGISVVFTLRVAVYNDQGEIWDEENTMDCLWSPYGMGNIFALWFLSSFLILFFSRLISAVADWMSAILSHMVWP